MIEPTKVGGVEIHHLYGNFDVKQAGRFLTPMGKREHFIASFQAFAKAQPPKSIELIVGMARADQRSVAIGKPATSNMVFLGLMLARDQEKFDQISPEAFTHFVGLDEKIARSDPELLPIIKTSVRFNCPDYYVITDVVVDRTETNSPHLPNISQGIWAGFMQAYIIGNKQISLDQQSQI